MTITPLPNNLRQHREKLGLRQIDVANKLGMKSSERISRWEQGEAFPDIENLAKLCLVYQTCFHYLYTEFFRSLAVGELADPNIPKIS